MPWLAIGVLAGFAVKVPLMPFHTWLPAAYAEAPSPVTMLLTGAMSKMGVYGLLRIALPLFGAQIAAMRTPLLVLAVITVVMGAWAAAAQKDLKRVFAYSSVNHLGYCLLGHLRAGNSRVRRRSSGQPGRRAQRRHPADVQSRHHRGRALLVHGHDSDAHRRAARHRRFRRPAQARAVFAGLMGIALFSSLGLPGLNSFVSEFLIFRGVFPLVLGRGHGFGSRSAGYGRRAAHRDSEGLHRPCAGALGEFPDLHHGERMALAPVIGLMFLRWPCAADDCGQRQSHGR